MTAEGNVPAVDGGDPVRDDVLGYGGQDVGEREKEAVAEALEGDYITRGPTVEEFESEFADYVGVENCVAVTSGTAALHLVGEALLDEGDELVTTPLTFASTANAASYADAKPVFADVKRETKNLDPEKVREKVTDDTEVVLPMHYAGHPCEIEELTEVAHENDAKVVWDSCHAIGGEWKGEKIGAQTDVATFSFHPVKTITTGEGGMVATDDDEIAEEVRSLRSFRMNYSPEGHEDEPWYQVTEGLGYNYNFTDMQAALGLVQLDRLDEFRERRGEIFERYQDAFADVEGLRTPTVRDDADPTLHLYVVEVHEEFGCSRKEFVNAMHAENIGVQIHYVPLNYHPFFQDEFGYSEGDFPVAEEAYEHILSLPFFPAMSDDDVEDVIRAVKRLHEQKTN
jgi:dTDP-4-amino-4,6-dideoxygalactose transaminase